jgi:type I restriction enzyme R subunit
VQIYEPGPDDPPQPPEGDEDGANKGEDGGPGEGGGEGGDDTSGGGGEGPGPDPPKKYYVDRVEVRVATERVQYLDEAGKLITESLKDYTRKAVRKNYASIDDFLSAWNHTERKKAILDELANQGVFIEELAEQVGMDYDPFDLVCHVVFDQPPLTRRERAEKVKKRDVFTQYGEQARAVLSALLDKYADAGILSVESMEILKVDPLHRFGTPIEILKFFGGKPAYLKAIHELENALYQKAA